MNFSFPTLNFGPCVAKLFATGRYGFSLPKKVEITTAAGETTTFLYHNRKVGLKSELKNRVLVKIAIAQFLSGECEHGSVVEINDAVAPFAGTLTAVLPTSPPVSMRVRPGRARTIAPREPRIARPSWSSLE